MASSKTSFGRCLVPVWGLHTATAPTSPAIRGEAPVQFLESEVSRYALRDVQYEGGDGTRPRHPPSRRLHETARRRVLKSGRFKFWDVKKVTGHEKRLMKGQSKWISDTCERTVGELLYIERASHSAGLAGHRRRRARVWG